MTEKQYEQAMADIDEVIDLPTETKPEERITTEKQVKEQVSAFLAKYDISMKKYSNMCESLYVRHSSILATKISPANLYLSRELVSLNREIIFQNHTDIENQILSVMDAIEGNELYVKGVPSAKRYLPFLQEMLRKIRIKHETPPNTKKTGADVFDTTYTEFVRERFGLGAQDWGSKTWFEKSLEEAKNNLEGVTKGTIKPSVIVGSGYGSNSKKVALEYLNKRVADESNNLKTKGLSYFTNGSNYESSLRKAVKGGKTITQRVLEEYEQEVLSRFPELKKGAESILEQPIVEQSTTQPAPTMQASLDALQRLYKINKNPQIKGYIDAFKRLLKLKQQ